MNGNWQAPYSPGVNGNTASDYINAWRHFHDLTAQAGAANVTWVWCPDTDPGKIYTPYSQLYPGDSYVDWTCLDGYNTGSIFTPQAGAASPPSTAPPTTPCSKWRRPSRS